MRRSRHLRPLTLAAAVLLLGAAACAGPVPAQTAATRPDVPRGQKVILVTGSTDGLGREVARQLAAGGAHVIVHGRNRERGEALVREITAAGRGSASFHAADLASLAEVGELAAEVLRDYDRLDVLINNAGIWLNRSAERQVSADGHELHFAVNYLSGYLLTQLLLPRLVASAPARIINVASAAQQPLDWNDVMLRNGYSGGRAYAQSKLAQVMFTLDLAHELDGSGVTVTALHPATLMETSMVREAGVRPRSTVQEGVDAVLRLVNDPVDTGTYHEGLEPARPHRQALDAAARARLRRLSEDLTRIPRD